jgi:hypothetical protein
MQKKNYMAMLLPLLMIMALFNVAQPVKAQAQDPWSTWAGPSRIYEGNWTTIYVSNPASGTSTTITIRVSDPSGATYSLTGIAIAAGATISEVYPDDFAAHTNYTGPYAITIIDESTSSPVAYGSFTVGLTDAPSYQRTLTVNIQAAGYALGEHVLLSIREITGTVVISTTLVANTLPPGGIVTYAWTIPINQPVDYYTVSLVGATVKPVSDVQNFYVDYATLSVVGFNTCYYDGTPTSPHNTFMRTENVYANFSVQYPDKTTYLTEGTWPVNILNPNGVKVANLSASYNTAKGMFLTTDYYTLPVDAMLSTAWEAVIPAQSIKDSSSNKGPITDAIQMFTVIPAKLTITIYMDGKNPDVTEISYERTLTIKSMTALITYPDGTPMTLGFIVNVTLTDAYTGVKRHVGTMIYNSTTGMWQDWIYKIPRDVPTGTWYITVYAEDIYLNWQWKQSTFTVTPAIFNVVVKTDKQNPPRVIPPGGGYAPGDTIQITATITYPDGTILTQQLEGSGINGPLYGYVNVTLYDQSGSVVASKIPLTFDLASGTWKGSYTKSPSETDFGIWTIQVDVKDSWVNNPPISPWLTWSETPYPNYGSGSIKIGNGVIKTVTPLMYVNEWGIDYWPAGPQGTNFNITIIVYSGAGRVGYVLFNVTTPETVSHYTDNMTAKTYAVGSDLYYVAHFPTDFSTGANTLELGRYLVEVKVVFTATYGSFGPSTPFYIVPYWDLPKGNPSPPDTNVFDVFAKISGVFNTQATQYLPGDRITWDINVTDARGIPIGMLYASGHTENFYCWNPEWDYNEFIGQLPDEPWWFTDFRLAYAWTTGDYLYGGLTGTLVPWWPSQEGSSYYLGLPCAGVMWHYGFLNYPMGIKGPNGTWVWCPWVDAGLNSVQYIDVSFYGLNIFIGYGTDFTVWPTAYNGTVPKLNQMSQYYSGQYEQCYGGLQQFPIEVPTDAKPGTYTYETYIFYGQAIGGYEYRTGEGTYGLPMILYWPLMGGSSTDGGYVFPNAGTVGKEITGTFQVASRISLNYVLDRINELDAHITNLITSVNGTLIAEIETSKGEVLAKLSDINATLVSVQGNVATINTTLGAIETKLDTINATLVSIKGMNATITTSLGTLTGKVTTIQGDVATILTDIGTMSTKVDSAKSSVDAMSTTLYIAVILALIAAIAAIVGVIQISRKIAA